MAAYIVFNKLNHFEPSPNVEYATYEEAEGVALTYLNRTPQAELSICKVEKKLTAKVVIEAVDPVAPVVEE